MTGKDSSILRAKIYICVVAAVGAGVYAMGGFCRVLSAVAAGSCRASPGMDSRGRLSLCKQLRILSRLRPALLPVIACYGGRSNSRCELLVGRGCRVLL